MSSTIPQRQIIGKLDEIFPKQREAIRSTCAQLKARLDAEEWSAGYVLEQAKASATAWSSWAQRIADNQTEILAAIAATGADQQDFVDRFSEITTAANTIAAATVANIDTRLAAIIDALPQETIL